MRQWRRCTHVGYTGQCSLGRESSDFALVRCFGCGQTVMDISITQSSQADTNTVLTWSNDGRLSNRLSRSGTAAAHRAGFVYRDMTRCKERMRQMALKVEAAGRRDEGGAGHGGGQH